MTLQLIISGKVIEEIDVSTETTLLLEDKEAKVERLSGFLQYKYRKSLAILSNWEIVLIAPSKMNAENKPEQSLQILLVV